MATSPSKSRPVLRPIEVTRRCQIRDKKTLALVSPHEICREYNEMLSIVQQVAVLGGADRDVVEQAQLLLRDGATASGGSGDGK